MGLLFWENALQDKNISETRKHVVQRSRMVFFSGTARVSSMLFGLETSVKCMRQINAVDLKSVAKACRSRDYSLPMELSAFRSAGCESSVVL